MLHSLRYLLCWTSGSGGGKVVVWGNPIGNRLGDVAVISPVKDEVAIVGELHVMEGQFCGNNW
jgi:hypothetical protein